MKKKLTVILLIVVAVVTMGCEETKPEPVAQTKKISGVPTREGTVDIYINYTALPGTIPSYLFTLETAIRSLPKRSPSGDLTINIVDGNSVFVVTDLRTLSAGESWISNANEDDMLDALGPVLNKWVAD